MVGVNTIYIYNTYLMKEVVSHNEGSGFTQKWSKPELITSRKVSYIQSTSYVLFKEVLALSASCDNSDYNSVKP